MKKKSHSESEMVKAVQQLESSVDAETIAREHGISRATLYNWKSKYSGMQVIEKTLESEIKKALANGIVDGDGFWKVFEIIRRDGYTWNHKKVYRVYKEMQYEKRKRLKK